MKKWLFLFICSLLPLMANASFFGVEEIDGIRYYIHTEYQFAVVWQNNKQCSGDIVIPETVEFDGVTCTVCDIEENAFYGCTGLTSVSIPSTVNAIGRSAFEGCTSLSSVTISNSVTYIGDLAFANCPNLSSIVIPNSVKTICAYAFMYCSSLTTVTIPESVTAIGKSPFAGCDNLGSIIVSDGNSKYDSRDNCNAIIETATNTLISGCKDSSIPEGVTSIDCYAFSSCVELTSITIPNSVTYIDEGAFAGCTSLTSIDIPNSVITMGEAVFLGCTNLASVTLGNNMTSMGVATFINCSSLTSVVIPNSVTIIEPSTFYDCTSLKSVSIGSGVKEVRGYIFKNCHALTDVYCYATDVPEATYDAFRSFNAEAATLHVPDELVEDYRNCFPWTEFGTIVGLTGTNIDQPLNRVSGPTDYYTLDGRCISVPSDASVNSVLPKGVYISNGKKVIIK